ncbi:uncharacterized protein LOC131605526 [Vicia villosa]|uniref:uncharacterized protein LOC131605526 n=1 Tax=Vicia villosa TaxID=3911 RepID=UPI00273B619B|nr:uncharacterized protein LOC131605526 [Vicia villosa]
MAMVAKQGWNILAKPTSLVARIFKARYFPRSSFLDSKVGNNPSYVWRSLWRAKDVLKLGSRWSIGEGRNITVMNDPWLREKESWWTCGPQLQGVYNLCVKDLLLPNVKQWDVGKVNLLFDHVVAEAILRVPLVEEVVEDRLVCQEERNGEYSVKPGYRLWRGMQSSNNCNDREGNWKNVWNILAPSRDKHLLWRICRGCLPTRTNLQQHHVQCSSLCPWCDIEEEDEWHVFFGCISTFQSWRAAGLLALIDSCIHSFHDAKSLIFDVCSREDRRDAGRFAMVLESLWRSRNNVVWQDDREDAIRIGLQAYHNWYDWFLARKDHNGCTTNNFPLT